MIPMMLAAIAGIWLFQFQPQIPSAYLFLTYVAVVGSVLYWPGLRLAACLVVGFAWAHADALWHRPATPAGIDLDSPVWVEGEVVSLVTPNGQGARFVLDVSRWEQAGDVVSTRAARIRVTWYRYPPPIHPGERWRLKLRVRQPAGRTNPGGFDYARWLYSQGIAYSAGVRKDPTNRRLGTRDSPSMLRLRQRLNDAMSSGPPSEFRARALLRALVIGDRAGFTADDWTTFTATGTNHLVAISGLHIGLVSGLVGLLVSSGWRRMPRLASRWPARQPAVVAGCLAALGYAALAGFSVPTQRALLMVLVAAGMLLAGRAPRPVLGLVMALLLVAVWQPVALLSPGLWLSFGAVGGMLWLLTSRRRESVLRSWVSVQLGLTLALLPLLLLFFGQASALAPLVNLLAIPWFSFVMVPAALVATVTWMVVPAWGTWAWSAWSGLAQPTLWLLDQSAQAPGAVIDLPAPAPLVLLLGITGVAMLLAPRGTPARLMGVPMLLPLLWGASSKPSEGQFTVTVLDVGQGLSVLVQTANHVLLYDAGPRFSGGFDAGGRIVVPALRALRVAAVDVLIVSHGDNDHAGGTAAVRQAIPVGRVLSGEASTQHGAIACQIGQTWTWDGVAFSMLGPARPGDAGNNASCVLRVDNGLHSVLLTGDIEAGAERELLSGAPLLPADVVVAPHHGSGSSSSAAFVRHLSPLHVVYATGRGNRWGFPQADVVLRWRDSGATAWNTATDGAVSFAFPPNAGQVTVRTHRREGYWAP